MAEKITVMPTWYCVKCINFKCRCRGCTGKNVDCSCRSVTIVNNKGHDYKCIAFKSKKGV